MQKGVHHGVSSQGEAIFRDGFTRYECNVTVSPSPLNSYNKEVMMGTINLVSDSNVSLSREKFLMINSKEKPNVSRVAIVWKIMKEIIFFWGIYRAYSRRDHVAVVK